MGGIVGADVGKNVVIGGGAGATGAFVGVSVLCAFVVVLVAAENNKSKANMVLLDCMYKKCFRDLNLGMHDLPPGRGCCGCLARERRATSDDPIGTFRRLRESNWLEHVPSSSSKVAAILNEGNLLRSGDKFFMVYLVVPTTAHATCSICV